MPLTITNGFAPTVRVIRYQASDRATVQGFFDISIGDILRANGLHLLRDGSIQSARLTPLVNNRRVFIPAIEIIDDHLRNALSAAILDAIQLHLKTLSPDQRMKPPRPPEPQQTAKPASAATSVAPVKQKPIYTQPPAAKPILPPRIPLLTNFPRRTTP
jgi:hypothetical protein